SFNLPAAGKPMPKTAPMPALPTLNFRDTKRADHGCKDARAGFSLDLWLKAESFKTSLSLLDSRDPSGKGIQVVTTTTGGVRIILNDGRSECSWNSDKGLLKPGALQHVVIAVDGGPKIITFVVDGILCDGGDDRQFGWGRFSPNLRTPTGAATLKIGSAIQSLRLYNRALRTSEAVGNWRAGFAGEPK
ncbi:MAG: LamG domain-containing protein, partial [Verrucomicrobia bacterium]|nr:LamG domain-containing protein [Verrucomicrobiota bacterium]